MAWSVSLSLFLTSDAESREYTTRHGLPFAMTETTSDPLLPPGRVSSGYIMPSLSGVIIQRLYTIIASHEDQSKTPFRLVNQDQTAVGRDIAPHPTSQRRYCSEECRSRRGEHSVSSGRSPPQLLRGGFIRPVHHTCQKGQVFKEIVLAYHDTSGEVVRFRNKLKSKFRQHAIYCAGSIVCSVAGRCQWLEKLQPHGARLQAEMLLDTINHLEHHKQQLRDHIAATARQFHHIKRFCDVPGIGLIRAEGMDNRQSADTSDAKKNAEYRRQTDSLNSSLGQPGPIIMDRHCLMSRDYHEPHWILRDAWQRRRKKRLDMPQQQ